MLQSTLSLALGVLAAASLCPAQVTATYATYGTGCPGTGVGLGATQVLPAAANSAWGSGNAIPFGWTPNRYQQIFLGSELPNAFTMAALSLRQTHTGPVAHNFAVDREIRVGYTTRWSGTMSTTFASNWDAGAPTLVLPRTADCPVGRLATAGLDTIAVRVPAHPVARAVMTSL